MDNTLAGEKTIGLFASVLQLANSPDCYGVDKKDCLPDLRHCLVRDDNEI